LHKNGANWLIGSVTGSFSHQIIWLSNVWSQGCWDYRKSPSQR